MLVAKIVTLGRSRPEISKTRPLALAPSSLMEQLKLSKRSRAGGVGRKACSGYTFSPSVDVECRPWGDVVMPVDTAFMLLVSPWVLDYHFGCLVAEYNSVATLTPLRVIACAIAGFRWNLWSGRHVGESLRDFRHEGVPLSKSRSCGETSHTVFLRFSVCTSCCSRSAALPSLEEGAKLRCVK